MATALYSTTLYQLQHWYTQILLRKREREEKKIKEFIAVDKVEVYQKFKGGLEAWIYSTAVVVTCVVVAAAAAGPNLEQRRLTSVMIV